MKDVTAAILIHSDRLLIARRRPDTRHGNDWEFPGGKVEAGESPQDCLCREMLEEFGVTVEVGDFFATSEYRYDHGCIRLLAYRTRWIAGAFQLRVHDELRWIALDELDAFVFLPADRPLVTLLKSILRNEKMPQTEDRLSPSANHHYLMNNQTPRLTFTGGDVREWQQALRPAVAQCLGMGNMPTTRVDLAPRSIWKRRHEFGTIEKIIFTSEAFADVPAYLCLPKDVAPPYPTFICLQGHSTGAHVSIAVQRDDETLPLEVAGDRDFGIGCMKRGMAALCIEQRSFGARRELRLDDSNCAGCHQATVHALMLGRTLIGERVYDVDRGIDYLESRGDIDMTSLGVMGNSGGGTISLFAAALLPRLRAAMPSCYFCTFADSVMSIYHCLDNYAPGLLLVAEMADVLGCFAPRPVTIVAGVEDAIFPIAGVRKAFAQLQKIYAAAGAPENCRLVVGPEGHRFYAEQGWSAMLPMLGR